MSQKITSRVEKLEEACGINQRCEFCIQSKAHHEQWRETLSRLGYQFRPVSEADIMTFPCAWCDRPVKTDFSCYSVSERVLFERLDAAHLAGTLCEPDNKNLFHEIVAAGHRAGLERYGELYNSDEAQALIKSWDEECLTLAESLHSRGIAPCRRYICRVDGCTCNYPKSEGEYQANIKARMKRAA